MDEIRGGGGAGTRASRPVRADARRNVDAILEAAALVFAEFGVDAPIRDIAARAGVGIGTLYRHFPRRSDLIVAIFRRETDACTEAARVFSREYEPGEALARWMQRFVDFVATKRGFAAALHSGDPAYEPLPVYFDRRLRPELDKLLADAIASGDVRSGVEADDLLRAVAGLCMTAQTSEGLARARRMVALLTDGLRYGARPD